MNRLNSDIEFFTLEQVKDFLTTLEMDYTSGYTGHIRIIGETIIPISAYSETRRIPTQFKVFFHIALFGGLRRGEILGLSWKDVDFKESSVSVNKSISYANNEVTVKQPKTKSSIRNIVLPEFVMTLLREYQKEYYEYQSSLGDIWARDEDGKAMDWMFIQTDGKLMHPSTPYGTFKDIIKKYNEIVEEGRKLPEITLHGLRHTHSTILISENVDVKTISSRLGHAKTSTALDIYTHAIKARDTVVADTLDNLFSKVPM